MSVIGLLAGGQSGFYGSSPAYANKMFVGTTFSSFEKTTLYNSSLSPSGQQGLFAVNGLGDTNSRCTFPDYPFVAASASRNWVGVLATFVFDMPVADADQDVVRLFQLCFNIATINTAPASYREVQLYSQYGTARTSGAAAATYTATSIQDTSKNFTSLGVVVGDYVLCNAGGSHKMMRVTSISTTTNTNDTLNGSAGWYGGTPGAATAYLVKSMKFNFRVTDGTTSWDGGTLFTNPTPGTAYTIDLKFKPTAGASETKLYVNGTSEINVTAGTNVSPNNKVGVILDTRDPGTGKGTGGWHGSGGMYNFVLYDDIASGRAPFDGSTYPITSPTNYLVTHRGVDTAHSGPRYDAYTKSSGSDVHPLLRDASTAPSYDQSTNAYATGGGQKQSVFYDYVGNADIALGADVVYGVMSYLSADLAGNVTDSQKVYHTTTTTDDVASAWGPYNQNPGVGAMVYAASLDPTGAPWTPTNLDLVQAVAEVTTFTTKPYLTTGGQFILFSQGGGAAAPARAAATLAQQPALMGLNTGII